MGMGTDRSVSPLDREQIARVEVGHTDISPMLARMLVIWFLLMLAALPTLEWVGARDAGPERVWNHLTGLPRAIADRLSSFAGVEPAPSAWTLIVTANRTALGRLSAFETALEDDSPVGRLLRPPAQQMMSGWLGLGNERVYVGRDGWLFYRVDVDYVTGRGFLEPRQLLRRATVSDELATQPAPDPRPAIRQFKRDLDQRGITLVLMPTPVKPTVYPDRLATIEARSAAPPSGSAAGASSMVQNASYAAFVEELVRDGVLVFDPSVEIARVRDESGEPAYHATDTHWRPATMQRVAERLAAFLSTHVTLPAAPRAGYVAEPREARQTGDTAAMLDLPEGQRLYPPETVTLRFVTEPDGDPWRSSRQADVLVLGDSFANMYSLATMGWGEAAGLVEQLSYALQRPVDRIVQNDQGAHATRALLSREVGGASDRLAGKRVVIWQFAARELAFGDWRVIPLPLAR